MAPRFIEFSSDFNYHSNSIGIITLIIVYAVGLNSVNP